MRKLLLLANPGVHGVNWVPQVFNVLARYRQYFKSPVGGYWQNDEIIDYEDILDPKAEANWVATHIAEMTKTAEYSIIVFVGHGGVLHREDHIQLSKGELCPINCLVDGMGYPIKRTVIIDACRTFIGANRQLLLEEQRTFSQTGQLLGNHCRDYYNQLISDSNPHVELIQSTQYSMPANTTERGTVFSDALFNTVGSCAPLWNHFASTDQSHQLSKTNHDVIEETCNHMGSFSQVPQISSSDNTFTFPFFAVRRA